MKHKGLKVLFAASMITLSSLAFSDIVESKFYHPAKLVRLEDVPEMNEEHLLSKYALPQEKGKPMVHCHNYDVDGDGVEDYKFFYAIFGWNNERLMGYQVFHKNDDGTFGVETLNVDYSDSIAPTN